MIRHNSASVTRGGKTKAVKNLGWLTSHARDVIGFEFVRGPAGRGGELIAHLDDGGEFRSDFADYSVARGHFLDRPMFRGLTLTVDGLTETIGSPTYRAKSNPLVAFQTRSGRSISFDAKHRNPQRMNGAATLTKVAADNAYSAGSYAWRTREYGDDLDEAAMYWLASLSWRPTDRAERVAWESTFIRGWKEAAARSARSAPKAPAKRMNGAKSVADPVAARELELYIENESALVAAPNSMGRMIMRNLARMIARGTYDSTKAWKAWMPLADEGAKRYTREFGAHFGTGFNKATREMVANALAEAFESEVRTGAIDLSTLLAPRANPRTRANGTAVPPLSGWRKDEYEYSAPVSGGRELVIRNFGITRPAWVPYVVFSDGHAAVAYKSLTGAALTSVSASRLGSESARYSHATPGAARALLAKAMSK